jgi:hypothetical protein
MDENVTAGIRSCHKMSREGQDRMGNRGIMGILETPYDEY